MLAVGTAGVAVGSVALAVGTLGLDIAMQCGMVANQVWIFVLRPDTRSRLNTVYMICAFLGGSMGAWLSVRAYLWLGWLGVCALVATLAAVAPARHLVHRGRLNLLVTGRVQRGT